MRILVVLVAALITSTAVHAEDPLMISSHGSFFTGGKNVTLSGFDKRQIRYSANGPLVESDPNGDFTVGQMYTEYTLLQHPKYQLPVLFWHGGGLTGATWSNTPDGRPGWDWLFASYGYNTYISDSVERGRSGWARFPEIYKGEPLFRTKKEAWEMFRIGKIGSFQSVDNRESYDDTKFPIAHFDNFAKQFVPRWVSNDDITQQAYDELVEKICPCVIVAHSSGVPFAIRSAQSNPEKVRAIVAVEAGGVPTPSPDLEKLKSTYFLWLYGDHTTGPQVPPYWNKTLPAVREYADKLRSGGASSEWIDLTSKGFLGNSHMLMMDQNSDQIAGLVRDWLDGFVPKAKQ